MDSLDQYSAPVFVPVEVEAIKKFHAVWENIDLNEPLDSANWDNFGREAQSALKVFQIRGKMSEETEDA